MRGIINLITALFTGNTHYILSSSIIVDKVVKKHQFWVKNSRLISNERQQKMLNKLMDHFEGNLNTCKWTKMTKTSTDTALRDITDLVNKGILIKGIQEEEVPIIS